MSLPTPELDDRKFQDLVDEAKRLIPKYCPEWTNHNLSDPGVALIELFAWMTEMTLYRINQVPDRYYTKFLELLGVDPFPPSVARTELTFLLSAPIETPVAVPAGTEVATARGGADEVVFTTVTNLEISQPHLVAAATSPAGDHESVLDVFDALRHEGESVTCFPSEPLTPGDALHLGFAESLAGNLIRLDIEASLAGIGIDPTRPPLAWEVWSGEAWIPARVDADTTGGLNREGHVVVHVPLMHAPLTLGATSAFWLRVSLLPTAADSPGYQASPRLHSVRVASLGGTVVAEHARAYGTETVGRSDGSPGQRFEVAHPPVLPRREGEQVQVITADGVERWEEVSDFSGSGPGDRHYTWDGVTGSIRFGPRIRYPDGTFLQHGAVPGDGADVVVTGYRSGGGTAGNVGANTLTSMQRTIPFIDRVVNPVPARGGVDAETPENAKLRAPMSIRTGERAVTARDFERLAAESSAAVARVRCLAPPAPGKPVELLVVPHVRKPLREQILDDFALGDDLIEEMSGHLDERRILGTSVEISTPFYQGVSVAALVRALPGRPPTLVRQRVLDLLYRYVNPLVGGPDGDGWPFDADLNASVLVQLVEGVEGIDRVDDLLLFEFDLRTGSRHGGGRDLVRLDARSLFLSASHQVIVR